MTLGPRFCERYIFEQRASEDGRMKKEARARMERTKTRCRTLRKGLAWRKVKIARDLVHLDIAVRVATLAAVNDGLLVDALVHALLD